MDQGSGPVIIQKKKKGHHGHHGGAWKVAYADFVTAMMALFIVLWILGQSADVKEAVQGYFRDPIGFGKKPGRSVMPMQPGGKSVMETGAASEAAIREAEKKAMQQAGEKILQELSPNPEFKDLMNQVQIEFVEDGMRIELLESETNVFFEIGTAQLNNKATEILTKIGAQLAKLNNRVILEGHTDSRPYSLTGEGYTNFELSAERANSARRALTAGGLSKGNIDEIRGYADRRLRNPKDPLDAVNRRISIIVKYSR